MAVETELTAMIGFKEARKICGIGESKMYQLLEDHEFTASRDGYTHGFRYKIRRDECRVYGGHDEKYPEGGLPALRKFRAKKHRN